MLLLLLLPMLPLRLLQLLLVRHMLEMVLLWLLEMVLLWLPMVRRPRIHRRRGTIGPHAPKRRDTVLSCERRGNSLRRRTRRRLVNFANFRK